MIVSVAWVGFTAYHTYKTSTISEKINQQIIPISPDIDLQTIEIIKSKKAVTPLYDNAQSQNFEASPSSSINQTTPTPTQTASVSAQSGGEIQP